jgi:hypothetical protein
MKTLTWIGFGILSGFAFAHDYTVAGVILSAAAFLTALFVFAETESDE